MNRRFPCPITIAIFTMLTLALNPAVFAQKKTTARADITGLEKAFAAQLSQKLAAPAAMHRIEISSRNGKTKQPGTLINPAQGWVVTSGDFSANGAKTVIVKRGDEPVQTGKIIRYSKTDHLLLIQIPKVADSKKIALTPPETGSFVGAFDKNGTVKPGTITSGIRAENKTFARHEQKALIAHWKRLGLKVSPRRTHFAAIFETDLDLSGRECGGPVFSSSGKLLGVVISRAGHHATLVIPLARIAELFAGK